MKDYMIHVRRVVVTRAQFRRRPQHPSNRLFDRDSEFCYMTLAKLRLDLVYGKELLGPLRHANRRDVQRANQLRTRFLSAITRHEGTLRRKGII